MAYSSKRTVLSKSTPQEAGPGPELTRLPNGLTIVTEAMSHAKTVSLGVHVKAGSRNEGAQEHGLSHLLEHMAFKGTKRRSALQIAEEIEAAGGELNASTSVETTAYDARLMGEDILGGLDILADILTNSVFDAGELKREKGVILQEIGAYEDSPEELVYDLFLAHAFPDQPLGRPILGTRESVRNFDGASIRNYLDREYQAPAMVISAAGAVEHEIVVEAAERLFKDLPDQAKGAAAEARYEGGEIRLSRRLEQSHIVLGLDGRSFADEEHYALQVFAHALGGGMSSRLFQEVREKRGLAYSIDAFHWAFSDCGIFGLAAGTEPADAAELLDVTVDCLAEATEKLTEAELQRTRAQVKVSLLTSYESPSRRAEQMARQLLVHGRLLTSEEIIARIDGLDVEHVKAAGRALLTTKPTLAIIGPANKGVPSLNAVSDRLKGQRLTAGAASRG